LLSSAYFRLGVATRREIVLVSVESWTILDRPNGIERLERDCHVQGRKIWIEAHPPALQFGAPPHFLVEVCSLEIFPWQKIGLEIASRHEGPGQSRPDHRQLRHRHLVQQTAHKTPLNRIVVRNTIASKPKESSLNYGVDVRRLVVPIGLKNGNVVDFQQHFRVCWNGARDYSRRCSWTTQPARCLL